MRDRPGYSAQHVTEEHGTAPAIRPTVSTIGEPPRRHSVRAYRTDSLYSALISLTRPTSRV